jgi:hypothetical protein
MNRSNLFIALRLLFGIGVLCTMMVAATPLQAQEPNPLCLFTGCGAPPPPCPKCDDLRRLFGADVINPPELRRQEHLVIAANPTAQQLLFWHDPEQRTVRYLGQAEENQITAAQGGLDFGAIPDTAPTGQFLLVSCMGECALDPVVDRLINGQLEGLELHSFVLPPRIENLQLAPVESPTTGEPISINAAWTDELVSPRDNVETYPTLPAGTYEVDIYLNGSLEDSEQVVVSE